MATPKRQLAPLPHEDPVYRPRKAGEIAGRHHETIRRMIRAGVIKGVRLGRRAVGVRASELARWMEAVNAGDPAALMPQEPKRPRKKLGAKAVVSAEAAAAAAP